MVARLVTFPDASQKCTKKYQADMDNALHPCQSINIASRRRWVGGTPQYRTVVYRLAVTMRHGRMVAVAASARPTDMWLMGGHEALYVFPKGNK